MGIIKTAGRAELEFDPDIYDISITIKAVGKTSGMAVTAGKKQTEQLLQSLQDELQIKPEQLLAERENVDKPSRHENQEADYRFFRTLCLKIPADNRLREAVTDLLAEMDDVTYMITERLSAENEQKQMAIDAAVQCARGKAEQLALSLGTKVTGFEEIITEGTQSISQNNKKIHEEYCFSDSVLERKSRAAELKNPKIKISGEVTVTWLTE